MQCFLCQFEASIPTLKDQYQNYHFIDPNEENFVNLFKPIYFDDLKCNECQLQFVNDFGKKRHMFLNHYGQQNNRQKKQIGGSRNVLRLNTLIRGPITNYSINFNQHKNFYDFFSASVVDNFLNSVYNIFKPFNKKYKFQGYFELVNQQPTLDNQSFLTENRNWVTNVYKSIYFNEFVRSEISNDIKKRIISNGLTGSSWYFKRFECLNITVISVKEEKLFKS